METNTCPAQAINEQLSGRINFIMVIGKISNKKKEIFETLSLTLALAKGKEFEASGKFKKVSLNSRKAWLRSTLPDSHPTFANELI